MVLMAKLYTIAGHDADISALRRILGYAIAQ